jgi:hypothetical protein
MERQKRIALSLIFVCFAVFICVYESPTKKTDILYIDSIIALISIYGIRVCYLLDKYLFNTGQKVGFVIVL